MRSLTIFFIATLAISFSACKENVVLPNEEIEVLQNFSQVEDMMKAHSDKTLVVNFWATTCPPCIKEMPHFRELEEQNSSDSVKVLLVNLDLARDFEKRVLPFVQKHDIRPEVVMLIDENYSAWTDKIDSSWYGALPATLITSGDDRKFRFGLYETFDELSADVLMLGDD